MSSPSYVSANQTALLTQLLPSTTYTLAYALPLLLSSLILTFAGAFLTLDRSRSFPPSYDSIPGDFFPNKRNKKLHWLLEGGIGGLAAGYVFGVHLSTFMTLIIPSLSASAPLSHKSFLPVWLLSALATTIPCGRWKYLALVASGISGGSTFSLALSVILHPPLLTRIILSAIILPSITLLTLLPLPRFQHGALRFALSSTGAFGVVLSISLLAGVDSWSDVWERLWVPDGPIVGFGLWGSGKEKGLSAAFCFLLSFGMICDWILRRRFGENPDQKWDSYLAHFAQNLPDRAGHFEPLTSFWSRLFSTKPVPPIPNDIVFPTDGDLKTSISSPVKLQKRASSATSFSPLMVSKSPLPIPAAVNQSQFQPLPGCLKKGRSQRVREKAGKRTRDPVKFGVDISSSDSDSDEADEFKQKPFERPWLEKRYSSSVGFASSLRKIGEEGKEADPIEVEKELAKVKSGLGEDSAPDYSDYEDDVTSAAAPFKKDRSSPEWSPDFLRRHRESGGSSTTSLRTAVERDRVHPRVLSPEGAVPVTPSLIKAFDRIAVAQEAAYGPGAVVSPGGKALRPGLPPSKSSEPAVMSGLPKPQIPREAREGEPYQPPKWDAFWKDVREKAGHAR